MVRQLALHFQRRIGMGVDIFHALKLYWKKRKVSSNKR
jgi:hypothetical protein